MTKITDVRAVDGVAGQYKFKAYHVDWTARLFSAEDACEVWVSCDVLPSLGYRAIEVPLGSIRDEDDMRDVIMRSDFEAGFKNLGMEFDLEDWVRSGRPDVEPEPDPEGEEPAAEEPAAEPGPRQTSSFVDQLVSDLTRDLGNEFRVQAEVLDDQAAPAPVDFGFSFNTSDTTDEYGAEPGFHMYFRGQKLF